jgi:hypothetical protein
MPAKLTIFRGGGSFDTNMLLSMIYVIEHIGFGEPRLLTENGFDDRNIDCSFE